MYKTMETIQHNYLQWICYSETSKSWSILKKINLNKNFKPNEAFSILNELDKRFEDDTVISIGGSVVECSPATRAARVRFPADAGYCFLLPMQLNISE